MRYIVGPHGGAGNRVAELSLWSGMVDYV